MHIGWLTPWQADVLQAEAKFLLSGGVGGPGWQLDLAFEQPYVFGAVGRGFKLEGHPKAVGPPGRRPCNKWA